MSTYTQILYQVVFGAKNYTAFLTNTNSGELFSYIAGILKNKKCHPYKVGGYGNHLHLIFSLHPTIPLSSLVKDIKKASHEMIKGNAWRYPDFPGWQIGYGGFTYSYKSINALINYVENQEQHHRKLSFREELAILYRENNIEFDEKYFLV